MLTPADDLAGVVCLLDRDMRHQPRRCGTVPVVLARLEEDAIAGPDQLDRAALALAEPDALGDPDRLAVRMRVPGGARARRDVNAGRAHPRALRRDRDSIGQDRSGEPLTRPRARL